MIKEYIFPFLFNLPPTSFSGFNSGNNAFYFTVPDFSISILQYAVAFLYKDPLPAYVGSGSIVSCNLQNTDFRASASFLQRSPISFSVL